MNINLVLKSTWKRHGILYTKNRQKSYKTPKNVTKA